jgi:O-antigen ligase
VVVLSTAVLAFGAVEPLPRFILQAGSMLLLAAWAVLGLFRSEFEVRLPAVLLPPFVFGAVGMTQVILHRTAYAYATWAELANLAAYVALMFVAAQLFRIRSMRQLFVRLAAGFGGLLAIFTLVQHLAGNGRIYWLRHTAYSAVIFGPYVDHGTYCGTALFLLPCAIVVALRPQRWIALRVMGAFSALFLAVTILISGSRSGVIAAVIQTIALVLYVRRGDRRTARAGFAVALLLFVATIGFVAWLNTGEVAGRLATLGNPAAAGAMRIAIVRDTFPMLKVHPFLGFGLGNFATVYPEYRSFVTETFVNYAHNEYAQLLVETGLLGFGVALWLFYLIFKRQSGDTGVLASIRLAALAACIGALVHSAFTFDLHTPANAAWFAVMCVAATLPIPSTARPRAERRVAEPVPIRVASSDPNSDSSL